MYISIYMSPYTCKCSGYYIADITKGWFDFGAHEISFGDMVKWFV